MRMNFQLLQRSVITVWVLLVCFCILITSRQLITQMAGKLTSGTIISNSIWEPPYAGWPHYDCYLKASGRSFTVPNSILSCFPGQTAAIRIDPLGSSRAQFDGDIFDNGSALAWYFLGLTAIFALVGGILKLIKVDSPWRTAANWLLDRLQGYRDQ
jgi:hypothetical protein